MEAIVGPTDVEPSVHLYGAEMDSGWDPVIADLVEDRMSTAEAATQIARHIRSVLTTDEVSTRG